MSSELGSGRTWRLTECSEVNVGDLNTPAGGKLPLGETRSLSHTHTHSSWPGLSLRMNGNQLFLKKKKKITVLQKSFHMSGIETVCVLVQVSTWLYMSLFAAPLYTTQYSTEQQLD